MTIDHVTLDQAFSDLHDAINVMETMVFHFAERDEPVPINFAAYLSHRIYDHSEQARKAYYDGLKGVTA